VRSQCPSAGTNQLVPNDVVAACRKYKAEGYSSLPKDSCGGSGAIQVLREPGPAKIMIETAQLHSIV